MFTRLSMSQLEIQSLGFSKVTKEHHNPTYYSHFGLLDKFKQNIVLHQLWLPYNNAFSKFTSVVKLVGHLANVHNNVLRNLRCENAYSNNLYYVALPIWSILYAKLQTLWFLYQTRGIVTNWEKRNDSHGLEVDTLVANLKKNIIVGHRYEDIWCS